MTRNIAVVSINASWNIVNFRAGLIAGLQRSGFDVVALAPADAYSGRLADLGVEHVPIAMDNQGLSPLGDLLLLWRYWRRLRRLRPALFLGYTAKPNVYGSLAAHLLGIKVINNVSGLGTAFIRQGLLTRIVAFLYKLAFRRSATVFFQNPEDRDLFLARGMVRPDQARLLPGSGVDLARFSPPVGELRPAGHGFTFLMVARLLWDKGVGEYVEAARLVAGRAPGARFQLLGFLDVANRTAVPRAEVERWTAAGLIEYLGHADDVRPYIAEADCIVLPSYREGLPRTLLEAGAMARPLIATDVPGCRHVVEEGKNGFLCAARSAGALADAMLKMLALPEADRLALGAAARAKVEREFDEAAVVAGYLAAIGAALEDQSAER